MATAPIGIAPVLTPKTIDLLVSSLDERNLGEIAALFRGLQPFAIGLVDKFHAPLLEDGSTRGFTRRFKNLAREYEPYRLYLNISIVSALQVEQFPSVYLNILRDIVAHFSDQALALEIEPELLSALLHDYILIITALQKPIPTQAPANFKSPVDQFAFMVDIFHRATRFDFALTTLFLVLEGSLRRPANSVKVALLRVCQRSLSDFAMEIIKSPMWSLEENSWTLESPQFRIAAPERVFQVIDGRKPGKLTTHGLVPSKRIDEVNWLSRNLNLSSEYRGKWVVIEKDVLIASDPDYSKARAIAKDRGIKRPFIIFVPLTESESFMGI